jgi:hypothetical protein
MAHVIGGIGTSHSPMLLNDPDTWRERADQDIDNPELYDNDGVVTPYDILLERAGDKFVEELDDSLWWQRSAACNTAMERLATDTVDLDCDVLVIVGDDQSEVFDDSIQPMVGIYWGETWKTSVLENVPPGEFFDNVKAGYAMDDVWTFDGAPELGLDMVKSTVAQGFDMASLARVPEGRGFGHAYGFVVRRLLGDRPVKVVPVLLNTYFPPNQPSAKRCYKLGQALARAVTESATDHKVMFVASGGLSHFVVNEPLDRKMLKAIENNDADTLCSIPQHVLDSGSSEIRNWIAVAGAMSGRSVAWSEYVPCYRTPAGTGCGMAFLKWS